MMQFAGSESDRYAEFLLTEVVPSMTNRPPNLGGRFGEHFAFAREDIATHVAALQEATRQFWATGESPGRDTAVRVLVGAAAFRAATPDYVTAYPDVRRRYEMAASWVCTNLGSLIWWDCN